MHDISKMFTTKIGLVSLCRVIPKNVDGYSFYYEPKHIVIVTKRSEFLMKEFSRERFKWEEDRT